MNACDSLFSASEQTLWLNNEVSSPGDLEPLQEDDFWSSPARTRYHAIKGPRVSALNAEDERLYEYNVESETDAQVEDSEDDYLEV